MQRFTHRFGRRLIWFLVGVILLSAPVILAGCARHERPLSLDDPEYPKVDPQAERAFLLKVRLPKQLSVEIQAVYASTSKAPECQATYDEGGPVGLGMSIPVNLQWSDTEQVWTTKIFIDRMKAGHCGWQFSGLEARVRKGDKVSISNEFIVFKPTLAAIFPVMVRAYEADHRSGPTWWCKMRPVPGVVGTTSLGCYGSKTDNERPMIDSDVKEVTFSIHDQDAAP